MQQATIHSVARMFRHLAGLVLLMTGMMPLTFGQVVRPDSTRSQADLANLPFLDLSDATKVHAASDIRADEVERATRYDNPVRPPLNWDHFIATRRGSSGSHDVLPVKEADVILTGQVIDSTPHLTKSGGTVYSTFTVKPLTLLKGSTLLAGSKDLTVEREGGVVFYPNGKKRLEGVLFEGLPLPGYTYLLFLNKTPTAGWYRIFRGYAFVGDKVFPLDRADYSEQDSDPTGILAQVRSQLVGR